MLNTLQHLEGWNHAAASNNERRTGCDSTACTGRHWEETLGEAVFGKQEISIPHLLQHPDS